MSWQTIGESVTPSQVPDLPRFFIKIACQAKINLTAKGNLMSLIRNRGNGRGAAFQIYNKATNNKPAVFTSTINRDSYFTTNSSELVQINNQPFAVGIGTIAEDPATVPDDGWWAYIDGEWVNIITILAGATGAPGMGMIDQSIPEGTLLLATDDNGTIVAGSSMAVQQSNLLKFNVPVETLGSGALIVGQADLSAGGAVNGTVSNVRFRNTAINTFGYPVECPFVRADGSGRPFVEYYVGEIDADSLSDTSDVRNAAFDFINPAQGTVNEYTIHRPADSEVLEDCDFTIWLDGYNGSQLNFNYKKEYGTGFTLSPGFNTVDVFPAPIGFPANLDPDASDQIRLYANVVDSNGNLVELSGQVVTFPPAPDPRAEQVWIPYLARKVNFSTPREMAFLDDLNPLVLSAQNINNAIRFTKHDGTEVDVTTSPFTRSYPDLGQGITPGGGSISLTNFRAAWMEFHPDAVNATAINIVSDIDNDIVFSMDASKLNQDVTLTITQANTVWSTGGTTKTFRHNHVLSAFCHRDIPTIPASPTNPNVIYSHQAAVDGDSGPVFHPDFENTIVVQSTGDDTLDGLTLPTAVETIARARTIAGGFSGYKQVFCPDASAFTLTGTLVLDAGEDLNMPYSEVSYAQAGNGISGPISGHCRVNIYKHFGLLGVGTQDQFFIREQSGNIEIQGVSHDNTKIVIDDFQAGTISFIDEENTSGVIFIDINKVHAGFSLPSVPANVIMIGRVEGQYLGIHQLTSEEITKIENLPAIPPVGSENVGRFLRGETGEEFVYVDPSMEYLDDYEATTVYTRNNVVRYQGLNYVVIADHDGTGYVGITPGTDDSVWRELSANTMFGGENNIYVALDAADNGNGTRGQPYKTLAAGLTAASAIPSGQHKVINALGVESLGALSNTSTVNNVANLIINANESLFSSVTLSYHATTVRARVCSGNIQLGNQCTIELSSLINTLSGSVTFTAELHNTTKLSARRMESTVSINFAGILANSHITIQVDEFDGTQSQIDSMLATIPANVDVSGWIGTHFIGSGMSGMGIEYIGTTPVNNEIITGTGDDEEAKGSGITLVTEDSVLKIPTSRIQGAVPVPTAEVDLNTGNTNLNQQTTFDRYVNKVAVYTGSSNIVFDLPTYDGSNVPDRDYDVGDVFAVKVTGSGNVTVRSINTSGGYIEIPGTTTLVVGQSGLAAIAKSSDTNRFVVAEDFIFNPPARDSNVPTFVNPVTDLPKTVAAGNNILDGNTINMNYGLANTYNAIEVRVVGFAGSEHMPASTTVVTNNRGVGSRIDTDYTFPSGINLPNAGDKYTIRWEVYMTNQTVGTDFPAEYIDWVIEAV